MVKVFNLTKDKYYKQALIILNSFLGLTDYELNIIIVMMSNNIKSINKHTRDGVRDLVGASTASFNNYIKRLKDKKALVLTDEGLEVNSGIIDSLSDNQINIQFNIHENN